jgi:hypothetical protein
MKINSSELLSFIENRINEGLSIEEIIKSCYKEVNND